MYERMSVAAQTDFAELVDQLQAAHIMRSVADLPGGFASKEVKGRQYWYYQYTDLNQSIRQLYIGRESEAVRSLISEFKNKKLTDNQFIGNLLKHGYTATESRQFKIIKKLADYGFFAAGGVLVGTHAFAAIGNHLGVKWTCNAQTQDVDFAHAGKTIALALPSNLNPDLQDAISSLEMGFVPMSSFNGEPSGTYVGKNKEDRIDFLTPIIGLSTAPIVIKSMNIALQPLKFMELALTDVTRSAVISTNGHDAIFINIPDPALFAIHKLITAIERGATNPKSLKDLTQAASLLFFYPDTDPDRLKMAWKETASRGSGWNKRMEQGLNKALLAYPEIGAKLNFRPLFG